MKQNAGHDVRRNRRQPRAFPADPPDSNLPEGLSIPTGPSQPTLDLTREEYFAERQLLLEARQRSYQRADQMIIGGATGALLLSVTFLEKLVPKPAVAGRAFLLLAWVILLLCLSLSLFAQYSSARSFDCEISRLDASVNSESPPRNMWARCNRLCGGSSAVFLVVGIAFLAWFAYINAPFS
jgi:hypothetical protein